MDKKCKEAKIALYKLASLLVVFVDVCCSKLSLLCVLSCHTGLVLCLFYGIYVFRSIEMAKTSQTPGSMSVVRKIFPTRRKDDETSR